MKEKNGLGVESTGEEIVGDKKREGRESEVRGARRVKIDEEKRREKEGREDYDA